MIASSWKSNTMASLVEKSAGRFRKLCLAELFLLYPDPGRSYRCHANTCLKLIPTPANFPTSLSIQRRASQPANAKDAKRQPITLQALIFACFLCNGGCAWETFGSAGFPFASVRDPAYSCHPRSTRSNALPSLWRWAGLCCSDSTSTTAALAATLTPALSLRERAQIVLHRLKGSISRLRRPCLSVIPL